MIWITLLTGLVCVGIGFWIKKYPNMIAGYNTMSDEERVKVDVEKVALILRNSLVSGGIVTIVGGVGFTLLNMPLVAMVFVVLPIMLSVGVAMLWSQKYDKTRTSVLKTTIAVGLIVGISAWICIGLYKNSRPMEVKVQDGQVQFVGSYGLNVALTNIKEVTMIGEMPEVVRRNNGLSLGEIKKGEFEVEGYEDSRLFLIDNNPPFIHLEMTYGEHIFFNLEEGEESIYKQIVDSKE